MSAIITRHALPRRLFLRGAGAAIALPWLDAMAPALSAAAPSGPARLGFFYVPNGLSMPAWRAAAGGACPSLGGVLAPLAPLRDHVTLVTGLGQPAADRVDALDPHARATSAWLSGMPLVPGDRGTLRGALTVDQVAARQLERETPLPSLELIAAPPAAGAASLAPVEAARRTIFWRGPDAPNPSEWNPGAVFRRLFGAPGEGADGAVSDRSLLDGVLTQARALERKLGPGDQAALDGYLAAIRAVEQGLATPERRTGAAGGAPVPPPAETDPDPAAHAAQLLDLLFLAFKGDLTRVGSFMFGPEGGRRADLDAAYGQPEVRSDEDDWAAIALFARFCAQLRETQEGDGTLLDRVVLLFGAGFSDERRHRTLDLPLAVVGGANGTLAGNRHLRYEGGEPEPMTNLLLSMLVKAGVRAGRLGDSTGVLPGF